jgi:hypothetical protein
MVVRRGRNIERPLASDVGRTAATAIAKSTAWKVCMLMWGFFSIGVSPRVLDRVGDMLLCLIIFLIMCAVVM